ncbi:TIR domain-containing protein, partial [Psychrobacter aquimaris]
MTTSDFDLAIMSGGDIVISKDEEFPTTRDNTIFELGLFMGFLGR